MFGNYSKFFGAIIGSVVGIALSYAASKGLGTCIPPIEPNGEEVCSVLGFTSGQITGALVTVLSSAAVFIFPKNKP